MDEFYCRHLKGRVKSDSCLKCFVDTNNPDPRAVDRENCIKINKVDFNKMGDLQHRYKNDPRFYQLVNYINNLILTNDFMTEDIDDALLMIRLDYLKGE